MNTVYHLEPYAWRSELDDMHGHTKILAPTQTASFARASCAAHVAATRLTLILSSFCG